ncbi:MAG: GNAT family N-acetyltransferase, partial [Candidatus Angelobacter sp.]
MRILLCPYRADDQEFLVKVYASTRIHEIAAFGWPAAQQEVFLRMQFDAQRRSYESAYGQADHQIIEQDGQPIGRLMVLRKEDSTLLVDIALLAEHRGLGIGGQLLRELIRECSR